ncbi:MAG TPA: transporter, partial [bacterium]|nr:transporter [bacterium]
MKKIPNRIIRQWRWVLLFVVFSFQGPAWAGNPFATDDPEPVERGHGEAFIAGTYLQNSSGANGTGQVEVNYGAFEETQFHLILTGAFNSPNGSLTTSGVGDMELGVKYRLVKEKSGVPQIGTYPKLDLPTGDASKGLGTGTTRLMIPVWFQKSWGPWTTYGGG